MNAIPETDAAGRIVIALNAEQLSALGLTAMPEPGRTFALCGTARARDAYPAGQDGPAEVTFELTPERLEPAEAAARPADPRAQDLAARPGAPRRDQAADQKSREAFFRSLFQEDD